MRKGRSGRKSRVSRSSLTPASLPRVSAREGRADGQLVRDEPAPPTPRVEVPSVPSLKAKEDVAPLAEVNPDEISIPPIVEADNDPEHVDAFFEAGERISRASLEEVPEDDEWENAASKKLAQKAMPHVAERRARFSRVVKWVAGSAAVLCALAGARALAPGHAPPAAAAQKIEAPKPAPEPAKVETPKVDVPPPVEAAPAAGAVKDEPRAADPDAAKADKKVARQNLERGKLADAIEAGERSVGADPTDGEAWLILGAAYQEKGNMTEARRCYRSCVEQGKRGPKSECAAMLR